MRASIDALAPEQAFLVVEAGETDVLGSERRIGRGLAVHEQSAAPRFDGVAGHAHHALHQPPVVVGEKSTTMSPVGGPPTRRDGEWKEGTLRS
jgi:hypothetical protein